MSTRTNDLDTPTAARAYRDFATLAGQFAVLGYVLIKGDPAVDGQALYYAMRLGCITQPLDDLEAVREYLAGLAGATHATT